MSHQSKAATHLQKDVKYVRFAHFAPCETWEDRQIQFDTKADTSDAARQCQTECLWFSRLGSCITQNYNAASRSGVPSSFAHTPKVTAHDFTAIPVAVKAVSERIVSQTAGIPLR